MKTLIILFLFFSNTVQAQSKTLKEFKLQINKKNITLSGISSGAFMAHQFFLAHSDLIQGVGTFAGGPYNCSRGNPQRAQELCMQFPEMLNVQDLIFDLESFEKNNLIAPLENVKNKRTFIFHGTMDKTIAPAASSKIEEIYQRLNSKNKTIRNIAAGHGWPTIYTEQKCDETQAPFLNNCERDLVGEMIQWFFPTIKTNPMAMIESNFMTFKQSFKRQFEVSIASEGMIYIPQKCYTSSCSLHIALHGCRQSKLFIQDEFAKNSGLNQWAEAIGMVVLYPQTTAHQKNPQGCWDWFGYTDSNFNNRNGQQIQFLESLIRDI